MEQKHKDKYMQNKLRDNFPADPQYCIGKLFEAINLIDVEDQEESLPQRIGRETRIHLAFSHAETLIKAINKFNVNGGVKVYHLAEQKCTTHSLYSQDHPGCQVPILLR
jgi:hypothetical protein